MQGVGFRHWTARTALSLGLTGWVRNLPDGSVEVQAQGERESLEKMAVWQRLRDNYGYTGSYSAVRR